MTTGRRPSTTERTVRGMAGRNTAAAALHGALSTVLGAESLPLRLRAWDGSEAGPPGAPVVVVRSRRALRRIVWAPGQLGPGRASVSAGADVEVDLFATFAPLTSVGPLAETQHAAGP